MAVSLNAYGALPTGLRPFEVCVLNVRPGIEVSIEGLLLRPTNEDLDFAMVGPLPLLIARVWNDTKIHSIDSDDFDWAGRVSLGYIFPNSGNDVRLSWTHLFKRTESDSTHITPPTSTPGPVFVTPIALGYLSSVSVVMPLSQYISGEEEDFFTDATGKVKFRFD